MKGRGCANQTFTLKGNNFKYQQPNVTCFIEFAAAFDSINGALDNDRTRRYSREDQSPHKSLLSMSTDSVHRVLKDFKIRTGGHKG